MDENDKAKVKVTKEYKFDLPHFEINKEKGDKVVLFNREKLLTIDIEYNSFLIL